MRGCVKRGAENTANWSGSRYRAPTRLRPWNICPQPRITSAPLDAEHVAGAERRNDEVLMVRERTQLGELWARGDRRDRPPVGPLAVVSQHLSGPATGFDPLATFGFEIDACGMVR